MKKLLLLLPVIIIIGCWSTRALAQQPTNAQQPVDEEEALDNAIEQFGYTSGMAFQCSSSNQAVAVEKDALKVFTGITRLFGSDRAFFYAAAYGTGATSSIDQTQCSKYIQQFQEAVKNNSLTGEK
ncbi:MAG: hypothetical protein ACM37W_09925 [Actinomycetota bacterium]